MLCLVTGATGFIGPHLIRSLHAEGHRVRVVARPESDIGVLPLNQVEVVEADLISGKSLRDALRGVEVVFHLAAPRRAVDPSTGKSRRPGNQDAIVKGDGGARRGGGERAQHPHRFDKHGSCLSRT